MTRPEPPSYKMQKKQQFFEAISILCASLIASNMHERLKNFPYSNPEESVCMEAMLDFLLCCALK